MLNKLIPQNSKLRQQLRFASRRANFAVTRKLKRRFTQPTPERLVELRELIETAYLPSWYAGMDMRTFIPSPEGQEALRNHLFFRLEMDRYEIVPWLNQVLPLEGARILEIGCGTGSATVALAEQGAHVTAMDLDAGALAVTTKRCEAHCVMNVHFVSANAQEIGHLFQEGQFDMILFFAVLEHMTLDERIASLKAAWNLLPSGGFLCLGETPNRLWPYDAHTSQLPFFNWLPDEIAFQFAQFSPRPSLRLRYREITDESMLAFRREGRGLSFHELDLALGSYQIVADQTAFLTSSNPIKLAKRLIARDGAKEKFLNAHAPHKDRALFRQNLDLVIQKKTQAP